MTIELTKNEAMWIIDKAAKTCVKGELAIGSFSEDEIKNDDELRKSVRDARAIVDAIAKLGLKIANALEKELDAEE